ncbi:TIGR00269 family protein [Candidatus Woesearchaeota archaeon]|nr:TIGR00269 family protein [Candidatus Woesearchaeota archaeon]
MDCCNRNPVIELNSGTKLCRTHFCKYFEKKIMRTIRRFRLLEKKEHIAVALSGGKDSMSLLYALKNLLKRSRKISISAILIDEGIQGYRSKTGKRAAALCRKLKVPLHIFSFRKEFNTTLDRIISSRDSHPCTECGILRRYLLNKAARKFKATKLATGHNLDDEAQAILMNQLRRNTALQARLGPVTGVTTSRMFVPRIKPFYLMLEKEVALYAYINGLYDEYESCPYEHDSFRAVVRDKLNDIENSHQGAKNNIVASFLDILPLLHKRYAGKDIPTCRICGEPSSSDVCNACKLLGRIKHR